MHAELNVGIYSAEHTVRKICQKRAGKASVVWYIFQKSQVMSIIDCKTFCVCLFVINYARQNDNNSNFFGDSRCIFLILIPH